MTRRRQFVEGRLPSWAALIMSGLSGPDIPARQLRDNKRHSMPQVRTQLLEGAWVTHARKIAISASENVAPAVVKAGQSSPVMLVSRLTINVARNSLSLATALRFRQDGVVGETVFLQWRSACWND